MQGQAFGLYIRKFEPFSAAERTCPSKDSGFRGVYTELCECAQNRVCQRGDLNSQGLLHRLLGPARLPISPPWLTIIITSLDRDI